MHMYLVKSELLAVTSQQTLSNLYFVKSLLKDLLLSIHRFYVLVVGLSPEPIAKPLGAASLSFAGLSEAHPSTNRCDREGGLFRLVDYGHVH